MKNQGPNLTSEGLYEECKGDFKKICIRVLQKCEVIGLTTLKRIINNAMALANQDITTKQLLDYVLKDEIVHVHPRTYKLVLKSKYAVF
jgi:hypothetical protein